MDALQSIDTIIKQEIELANQQPMGVGVEFTLHFDSFYHANCKIVDETAKAYKVSGSPDCSRNKTYSVWFPKKSLEVRATDSTDTIFYSADVKKWFWKMMSVYHHRLVGALS